MSFRQSRLTSARSRKIQNGKSFLKYQNVASEQNSLPVPFSEGHLKDFRIPQQGVYNYLKNSIAKTFAVNTNPVYKDVKQLTFKHANDQQKKRLDKMFIKYSITVDPKKKKFGNTEVDAQFISKNYVRNRSREKKRQQSNKRMKKDVNSFYYQSVQQNQDQKPFYEFKVDDLRHIERRYKQKALSQSQDLNAQTQKAQKKITKRSNSNINFLSPDIGRKVKHGRPQSAMVTSYKHPYLKIYEQMQNQTFSNFLTAKHFSIETDVPDLTKPEQWEQQQRKVKGIYQGVKKMRQAQSAKQKSRRRSTQKVQNFYLT